MSQKIVFLSLLQVCELRQNRRWGVKYPPVAGLRVKRIHHIDLLLLTENDKTHYTWIRKMSRLVAHTSNKQHASFVCPHCVHKFTTEEAFTRHFADCSKHIRQQVVFPEPDKETLK